MLFVNTKEIILMGMRDTMKKFAKSNPVLTIAGLAAVISMFFVPPNAGYASYIDWRTIMLLCCQLLIVQGLMHSGLFKDISEKILSIVHDTRTLAAILTLLCFFGSMLVTNDVSLISFVPLTIVMLAGGEKQIEGSETNADARKKDRGKYEEKNNDNLLIRVLVLQTIAANLGSMFTPFGNPQNLYLFNLSGISGIAFLKLMAPYTGLSLLMIVVSFMFVPKRELRLVSAGEPYEHSSNGMNMKLLERIISSLLMILCIMAVFHVVNVTLLLVLCVVVFMILDRNVIRDMNYILPLTFIAFFILTGNIKAFPGFSEMLSEIITGHEMLTGVVASQIISNVPAAMLLSSFTNQYRALIIGTNIGGLGTLIASMASLISFQFYNKTRNARPGRYIGEFTVWNIIFLVILVLLAKMMGE